MGITDFIKLGMLGIKPAEIKELKEELTMEQIIGLAEKGYTPADMAALAELAKDTTEGNPSPDPEPKPETKDEIPKQSDDKKEENQELLKAQQQILKLQSQLAGKDLSGGKTELSNREKVKEIFRNIY